LEDTFTPWLEELPDPISKVTWGNYAAVAPALARNLGLTDGEVVKISCDRGQLELPVFEQPGQQAYTISIAVGYGRKQVGKVGQNVGVNVFPLTPFLRWPSAVLGFRRDGREGRASRTRCGYAMHSVSLDPPLATRLQHG
jgi:anaerobic selenocysteine-containing dehydrogenase